MAHEFDNNPYEASDEASENELLDKSLSVWKGWNVVDREVFAPISLDIHTASSIGHYDTVRSIIQRREEDLDKKNRGGWSPLMYACYIGHDNIVNLLLEAHVNVNCRNHKGQTPLMLAASCGNESVGYFLCQQGAELEAQDKKGWTALFHATYSGHQNMVKFLLDHGCNINATEPTRGITPFMEAAAEGHEIIVQVFLQHGVTMDAKAFSGDMARSLALMRGHMKIVSLIDNHTAPVSNLRAEAGLFADLSSSDEAAPRPRHRGRGKSKGPSIRDGPEAFARYLDRGRCPDTATQYPNSCIPKGYVTFNYNVLDQDNAAAVQIRSRDVTSPINPEDHTLDSSGGKESLDQDHDEDWNAFSKTGAITIKSSSSSSGGLAAALGISRENSLDSNEDLPCDKVIQDQGHISQGQEEIAPQCEGQGPCEGQKELSQCQGQISENNLALGVENLQMTCGQDQVESLKSDQHESGLYSLDHREIVTESEYSEQDNINVSTMPPNKPDDQGELSMINYPHGDRKPDLMNHINDCSSANEAIRVADTSVQNCDEMSQSETISQSVDTSAPDGFDVSLAVIGQDLTADSPDWGSTDRTPTEGDCPHRLLDGRPTDLTTMLEQIGMSKYRQTFEEQDVDLQVFLSLTENDLKELGIKKFGCRRKMTIAIARWHSNAKLYVNSLEQVYANKLEADMQEMAIQLHKAIEKSEKLTGQVLQEQELRSVTEACLMEERATWTHVTRLITDTRHRCDVLSVTLHKLWSYHCEVRRRLTPHNIQNPPIGIQNTRSSVGMSPVTQSEFPLDDRMRAPSFENLKSDEIIRKLEHYLNELQQNIALVTMNTDRLLGSRSMPEIPNTAFS